MRGRAVQCARGRAEGDGSLVVRVHSLPPQPVTADPGPRHSGPIRVSWAGHSDTFPQTSLSCYPVPVPCVTPSSSACRGRTEGTRAGPRHRLVSVPIFRLPRSPSPNLREAPLSFVQPLLHPLYPAFLPLPLRPWGARPSASPRAEAVTSGTREGHNCCPRALRGREAGRQRPVRGVAGMVCEPEDPPLAPPAQGPGKHLRAGGPAEPAGRGSD